MHQLVVTQKFEKDFKKIPHDIKLKTEKIVQTLKRNPFAKNLNIKKLKGFRKSYWRVKIDKNYRLIYTIKSYVIELRRIRHRREIYKVEF